MSRLISEQHWTQIRHKAALPQFAAALRHLHHNVQDFSARPVTVPDKPGGYYHDYFCPQHGVQLVFDPNSPQGHRCPVGDETFRGEPFDSAWRWFVNDRLAQAALQFSILWNLKKLGNDQWPLPNETPQMISQRVKSILWDYATNYAAYKKFPPRTPNPGVATYTTLDESVWAIALAWSFDLIRAALSPSEQRSIVVAFLLPIAEHLVEHHFQGIHNFACWHNAAIGTLGVVTGQDDLVAFAIEGPYGFHTQMREGVLADGLWFEGSFSYHFYTVAALLALVKATANLPAWDLRQAETLASLLRAPMLCAYPDGTLPATNDCWYFSSLLDECCHGVPKAPAFYEVGYAWFHDMRFGQVLARAYQHGPRDSLDALLFGVETLPTAEGPALGSVHMPASGYAILRSNTSSQGKGQDHRPRDRASEQQYLLLKYGPHGGGHGHPDKLGLTVFAHGCRLSPDLGTPGYGIDLFESWYRQSVSHNTVLLDGRSQPPATGTSNAFRAYGPFQVADASVGWGNSAGLGPYSHVSMRRAVLACTDYFLDIFLVDSLAEQRIDWIYRNAGELAPIPHAHPLAAPLQGEGYHHIRDVHSLHLDCDFCMCTPTPSSQPHTCKTPLLWRLGQAGMQMFMADLPRTTVISGTVPGNPPDDRQGLIIRQRETAQTAFFTVFHPYQDGNPQISAVTWHGQDLLGAGWAACSVERAQERDLWIIRLHKQVTVPLWLAALPADKRLEYTLN